MTRRRSTEKLDGKSVTAHKGQQAGVHHNRGGTTKISTSVSKVVSYETTDGKFTAEASSTTIDKTPQKHYLPNSVVSRDSVQKKRRPPAALAGKMIYDDSLLDSIPANDWGMAP